MKQNKVNRKRARDSEKERIKESGQEEMAFSKASVKKNVSDLALKGDGNSLRIYFE